MRSAKTLPKKKRTGARLNKLTTFCIGCTTELPSSALVCPNCRKLVHTERLKTLAQEAEGAEKDGDVETAITLWREAHSLLPPETSQAKSIGEKIAGLSKKLGKPTSPVPKSLAALGAFGLLIWKFKFLLVGLLSKGKLLIFGLSKVGTLKSMALFVAIAGSEWGWAFGLGLVVSIYIHEMGHVASLVRHGIPAEPPMFVPGLGAFVRLKQSPANKTEDAAIGLAGPVWGLAAAVVCALVWYSTGSSIWGSLAKFGALINLFNLLPFWQLDGGRGVKPLTRGQRVVLLGVCGLAYLLTQVSLLLLIGLLMIFQLLPQGDEKGHPATLGLHAFLLLSLSVLSALPVALS